MHSSIQNSVWEQPREIARQTSRPRICLPTCRKFRGDAFRSALYEAQDVLLAIDDVDLICLEPGPGFRLKERSLRRLLYHDVSRTLMFLNPGLQRVRLTREYDLFVAIFQFFWEIPYINAIHKWKDHCKTSVCWIDEIWSETIPTYKYRLDALAQFDHVFVGCRDSVPALSKAINRSCRWLPGAVDTVRFSPYPKPPPRVIDVYSIGRRCEGIHRALLQAAGRREVFYMYDTFQGADTEVYNHQQHRDLFANVAKRSRYFSVAPGKMDSTDETHGQVEIGYRYYEGAAAGAVMIGQPPICDAFTEMFQWPDAVIPIRPDGSDVIDTLTGLRSEPERVAAISRRNAREALLHHDWLYRWKEILRVAGLEPSAEMAAREQRLRCLADLAASAPQNVQ